MLRSMWSRIPSSYGVTNVRYSDKSICVRTCWADQARRIGLQQAMAGWLAVRVDREARSIYEVYAWRGGFRVNAYRDIECA